MSWYFRTWHLQKSRHTRAVIGEPFCAQATTELVSPKYTTTDVKEGRILYKGSRLLESSNWQNLRFMGGESPRGDGPPRRIIKGSDWCCNKDLNSRMPKLRYRVVISDSVSGGVVFDAADWSSMLPPHERRRLDPNQSLGSRRSEADTTTAIDFGESLGKRAERCSDHCWAYWCSLCSSIMSKIQVPRYELISSGSGNVEVLLLEDEQGIHTKAVARMASPSQFCCLGTPW
ncbi:hypothetical protein SELMODRAFT_419220 [Selaginella moellendorffii]|uniref:Uncharacterized protein n=1 Tax=Selaginella moellendorffii TaxID=88036 RepID=D8S883_SELML|nr:hypothetical protein SELMODRAFT_419220 [Selaginella moellendorffii]